MEHQKTVPLDYERRPTRLVSPTRDLVHVMLHSLLTLFPLLAMMIGSNPEIQLVVMFVGLGVGTGVGYYLFRESRFRKWAKILFSCYALCTAWLLILYGAHAITRK